MNIVLWVLQIALALLCISGGAFQMFKIEELQQTVAAMRELPRSLWAFLGAFGCVAGLGLIVAGPMKVPPAVTPIAAAAVAVESVFISLLYLRYRDFDPLPYSVAMAIMGVIIAYGRLALRPLGA